MIMNKTIHTIMIIKINQEEIKEDLEKEIITTMKEIMKRMKEDRMTKYLTEEQKKSLEK